MNITHSVLTDNIVIPRPNDIDPALINIVCSDYYPELYKLRQMNPPITSIEGRLKGINLDLNTTSLSSYTMRRKAETLQYRKNQAPFSKKKQFSQISNNKTGSYYYSVNDLLQQKKNNLDCPNLDLLIKPPTNSGIRDYKFSGYYYDVNVKYLPSL